MTARATRLSDLGLTARAGRDPALSGVTADSRAVRAGMLFAALPGTATHGARFIGPAALEQGACGDPDRCGRRQACLAEVLADSDVALVVAEDPRAALACAAALWFGAAARDHGCGDRHQRQDERCDLHPADLGGAGT